MLVTDISSSSSVQPERALSMPVNSMRAAACDSNSVLVRDATDSLPFGPTFNKQETSKVNDVRAVSVNRARIHAKITAPIPLKRGAKIMYNQ